MKFSGYMHGIGIPYTTALFESYNWPTVYQSRGQQRTGYINLLAFTALMKEIACICMPILYTSI